MASTSDRAVTWQELERASPAELAQLIPSARRDADTWTAKRTTRIPGIAQWRGMNVELAAPSRPTGWSGLCAFDTVTGYFEPASDVADRLVLSFEERAVRYRLTARHPGLVREQGDAPTVCAGDALSTAGPTDLIVTAGKSPATLAQTRYAIRTIAAALSRSVRCRSDDAELCNGIAFRAIDITRMYRLNLAPCPGKGQRWCVRGQWDRPRGNGPVFVEAETAIAPTADLDTAHVRVRGVTFTTYLWPIM